MITNTAIKSKLTKILYNIWLIQLQITYTFCFIYNFELNMKLYIQQHKYIDCFWSFRAQTWSKLFEPANVKSNRNYNRSSSLLISQYICERDREGKRRKPLKKVKDEDITIIVELESLKGIPICIPYRRKEKNVSCYKHCRNNQPQQYF